MDYDSWPFKMFAYTLADNTRDSAKDIALDSINTWQQGLWSDGTTLWVVDSNDARLYAYTLADGSRDAENDRILDPANTAPRGLTSVEATLYVADADDAAVYIYENRAPEALGTLPDQTLTEGGSAQTLTVTSAFRDLDGDALAYTAESSAPAVAIATESGAEVTVHPVGVGTATIRVRATDPDGLSVTQDFDVTVVSEPLPNQEPQPVGELPALELAVGGDVQIVPIASLFRDPDGDALTYTATSSNTRVATVKETMSGGEIEVRPVAGGTVTVTVTATDMEGSNQTATQRFTVTVDGPPPSRRPGGGGGGGRGGSRDRPWQYGHDGDGGPTRQPGAVGLVHGRPVQQCKRRGLLHARCAPGRDISSRDDRLDRDAGDRVAGRRRVGDRRQRGGAPELSAGGAGGSRAGRGGRAEPAPADRGVSAGDAVTGGLSGEPRAGFVSEWGGRAVGLGVWGGDRHPGTQRHPLYRRVRDRTNRYPGHLRGQRHRLWPLVQLEFTGGWRACRRSIRRWD